MIFFAKCEFILFQIITAFLPHYTLPRAVALNIVSGKSEILWANLLVQHTRPFVIKLLNIILMNFNNIFYSPPPVICV